MQQTFSAHTDSIKKMVILLCNKYVTIQWNELEAELNMAYEVQDAIQRMDKHAALGARMIILPNTKLHCC